MLHILSEFILYGAYLGTCNFCYLMLNVKKANDYFNDVIIKK